MSSGFIAPNVPPLAQVRPIEVMQSNRISRCFRLEHRWRLWRSVPRGGGVPRWGSDVSGKSEDSQVGVRVTGSKNPKVALRS